MKREVRERWERANYAADAARTGSHVPTLALRDLAIIRLGLRAYYYDSEFFTWELLGIAASLALDGLDIGDLP